jgi:phage tail sheath protein FI
MPSTLNAPGIYIEELPSGVHPITGVSTSNTAFVDWFRRGPVGAPTRITSFTEFTRVFGGLHAQSEAGYAILQYFQQGGTVAWIVRLADAGDTAAALDLKDGAATPKKALTVMAASPGAWGSNLQVAVTAGTGTFSIFVREVVSGRVVDAEVFRNLVLTAGAPNSAVDVVNATSRLVRLAAGVSTAADPEAGAATPTGEPDDSATPSPWQPMTTAGADTPAATLATSLGTKLETAMRTLVSIEPDVFNLLCIPAMATLSAGDQKALVAAAATFCAAEHAFLLVDPPATTTTAAGAQALITTAFDPTKDAAAYYPRLLMPDPLAPGRRRNIGPSGVVAGTMARTDASRGVWKAPAGIDAVVGGVDLAVAVTEADSASLNPVGINAFRSLPVIGNVVWGARTLFGADTRASEWKYVPVRRTALYLEQSLDAGLKWVVFEPNDEPLWSQIRLNVGAFMQDLFRKGAFQGTTPREAYFVGCDRTTTTQSDVDRGVVNILVGFAPLKPAEFVVIQIQQLAGQASA